MDGVGVVTHPDAALARDLLREAGPATRGRSDRMLAAAQVHATLAVEQAVRDLIGVVRDGLDETEPERPVRLVPVNDDTAEVESYGALTIGAYFTGPDGLTYKVAELLDARPPYPHEGPQSTYRYKFERVNP
jgi:hypothetical protein